SSSGLVLALAFLPLLSEVAVVTLAGAYVLDVSWRWAFLLASLTAPMSPLVVMWTALQLRLADLGTPTAVCSLLLVVCALDWAAGLCLSGVALKGAMQTESWSSVASGFAELISGILLGSVFGFFSIYVPNEHNVHATFYRVEMLLAVNVCFVVLFHYFMGMPAIGYLSAFTTACTTLRTMMSLSWLILEPLTMSIVGPHIMVSRLGGWRQLRYIGVLFTGLATRLVVSALCCLKSSRHYSERSFICIAFIPKGTIQLVSCSLTLSRALSESSDKAMGELMMDCCTLALLLTGPLGSLLSSLTAPRLLRHRQPRSSFLELQEPDMSF
ncbi:Sodium/hydrogen exchanger 9B2, partial [Frankliniella fusca]